MFPMDGSQNKQHREEGQKDGVSAGILINLAGANGVPDVDISIRREEEGLLRARPRIVFSGWKEAVNLAPSIVKVFTIKTSSKQSSQDKINRILYKPWSRMR